jgi:membrane-associated phospholipid phosphatase
VTSVYITWVTGALLGGILLMPLFKPRGKRVTLAGFVDMFRRYWMHIAVVFSIYVWKDLLDSLDRILMANARLDMTPFVYAVEGDLSLWVQQNFLSEPLTFLATHFYVAGYMLVTYCATLYFVYFDDRWMADRLFLAMFYVYALAVPFYLFFNVRVTGDFIPGMETLAYNLTPEIQTWFTRIDPFTNGMPSLHIGLPFAAWLSLHRWDHDNRWRRFRIFLGVFTLLTGFVVVYLGIHWFVDIIGGMVVAAVAVQLSERSHARVWHWLDERAFNARLAWLLADLSRPLKVLKGWGAGMLGWLKRPSAAQTSSVIALMLLATGGVLLYDATHQDFPAEGVTWPEEAAGAGGWLAAVEETAEGDAVVTMWNLSTGESYQQQFTFNDEWGEFPVELLLSEGYISVWHGYDVRTIDLDYPTYSGYVDPWVTGPLYEDIALLDKSDGGYLHIMLNDGAIEMHEDGGTSVLPTSPTGEVMMLAAGAGSVAYVEEDTPTRVTVKALEGPEHSVTVELNVTLAAQFDEQVELLTGTPVDYVNASVSELALDRHWLAAVVNLSAVDRLVLVNLDTGEQRILGDPLFPVAAPSLGYGHVAWQHQQFLNSLDPTEDTLDWDVRFHVISENRSYRLHGEDAVNQTSPQVMEGHIAWLQEGEADEPPELRVHTLEETFEPYSSSILQLVTILMIPLLVAWSLQRQRENGSRDEEE